MRAAATLIVATLMVLAIGCCIYSSDDSYSPESTGPEYMGMSGDCKLYKIDLNDGPIYYYEYPDGKIRIVSSVTIKMNIIVETD